MGWQEIVAIIDGRGPIKAPPIPRAERASDKRARHKARSDHPSPSGSADNPAHAADGAASSAERGSIAQDPSAPLAPGAPAAAAPSAGGQIVDFSASSQTGGLTAATGNGGYVPPPFEEDPWPRRSPDGPDDIDLRLAYYPHTDLGNAERFRERNRGKLIWCAAIGWLWWNGRCWSRDGADDIVKSAEHETVRGIQREADALRGMTKVEVDADPQRRHERDVLLGVKKIYGIETEIHLSDALASWGRVSEQRTRLTAIADRAAPSLAVAPEQLDFDPFKFNVANGTLIFRRRLAADADIVSFRAHDPRDLMTKCSKVAYDPKAQCPAFDVFLAEVQPDAAQRRFVLQWQGLSLTGDIGEQKLFIFWGKGRNGKSTFSDICAHVAGDYAGTVPIETFLNEGRSRNAGQATPDLAMLPGVRMLQTSEPNRGAKLDESLIKLTTGGDPIMARHLNRGFFKFYPQFKLTISGNYRPDIRGSDEGIWRRPKLVPWTVTIDKDKVDRNLGAKLRTEASGILNRLLDGLRDWLDNGLVEPTSVRDATADYRRDSDPLGRFLEACIAPEKDGRVQSSAMHELFVAWARANGAPEWSNKGMTAALKEKGFATTKSDVMFWLDVKLTRDVGDFIDRDGKPIRNAGAPEAESLAVKGGKDDDRVDF